MSVLTTFIIKKEYKPEPNRTEPKSGKDEPKPNHEFWVFNVQCFPVKLTLLKRKQTWKKSQD